MELTPETLIVVALGLALAPVILGAMTCYLKVTIVLSSLKSAFGVQSFPGTFVIFALSISVSAIVMKPVFDQIVSNFVTSPVNLSDLNKTELSKILANFEPLKLFLLKNANEEKLIFFKEKLSQDTENWQVALGAFLITELEEAFHLALLLYLPFFIIDICVSAILVSLGMFMLSPVLLTLPLKILLLVFSKPWTVLIDSFISSYT